MTIEDDLAGLQRDYNAARRRHLDEDVRPRIRRITLADAAWDALGALSLIHLSLLNRVDSPLTPEEQATLSEASSILGRLADSETDGHFGRDAS